MKPSSPFPVSNRLFIFVKDLPQKTITWIGSFRNNKVILRIPENACWSLDFALDHDVYANGQLIEVDSWALNRIADLSKRTLIGEQQGQLISIFIHENHYLSKKIRSLKPQGHLTVRIIHCLLNLLNKTFGQVTYPSIWTKTCIDILINDLSDESPKSSFNFNEIKTVFLTVESLGLQMWTPHLQANKLMKDSKLLPHRFRMICLEMYGISLHSILHNLKSKTAFELVSQKKLTFSAIAKQLGYKHSASFATKFREYFGVTPTTAASFYDDSLPLA